MDGVKEGLRIIKEHFDGISIVDLGGGFGVPYKKEEEPLNLIKLAKTLSNELNKFIKDYPSVKEFKFEIGRYIPCEAGIIMGEVNAIKCENGVYWIGTDIGMNELVRPSMYNSYHEVTLLDKRNTKEVKTNICGNICESGDVIGRDRLLTIPKVGDKILVHNAGAYGFSMASNYTGRARPAEILLFDNKVKLIRKRETIESMEDDIVW
jgi:diaminopimelate decarboxylase